MCTGVANRGGVDMGTERNDGEQGKREELSHGRMLLLNSNTTRLDWGEPLESTETSVHMQGYYWTDYLL